jgi:hypothetical protein
MGVEEKAMPHPTFTRMDHGSPSARGPGSAGSVGGGSLSGSAPWTPGTAPSSARSAGGDGSRSGSPAREVVSAGGKVMRISVRSPGAGLGSGGGGGTEVGALTPAQAQDRLRRHMLPPSPWARVSSHVSFMRSERVALAVILASAGACVVSG